MKRSTLITALTLALSLTTTAHAYDKFEVVDCPTIDGYSFGSSCEKNTLLFPIRENTTELYGYANLQGDIIVKPQFEQAYDFDLNKYSIVVKNGKSGAIDTQGNIIIPFEYDRLLHTSAHGQDYFSGLKNDKIGLLDTNNRVVIDFIYDTQDGEYGYLLNFRHGLAYAEQNGKIGYIDITGKTVIPFIYDDVNDIPFDTQFIGIKKNGKWGVVDRQNNIIIPFIYKKEIFVFENDVILVEKNNKLGIIDQHQNIIIPMIYESIFPMYNDGELISFKVQKGKKYGILDRQGKALTGLDYDEINGTSLKNTLITRKNNLMGAIDLKGNIIIPTQYYDITYHDDLFQVKNKLGKVGYVDNNNRVVVPLVYDELIHLAYEKEPTVYAKQNGKVGIISMDNKIIIPFIYDEIDNYDNGQATVTLNGETFDINAQGNRIK